MNERTTSPTIERLLSRRSKDEVVLHTWQFELARRIAQVLEEEDITQSELAARAGLTNAQVSALLHSNANPTLATLAKIAGFLGTPILSIVNSDEEREKPKSIRRKLSHRSHT